MRDGGGNVPVYSDRARINLVVGEAEAGGNHLLEFRGFESLPVKPSQQPEPSLACECGNALLEA